MEGNLSYSAEGDVDAYRKMLWAMMFKRARTWIWYLFLMVITGYMVVCLTFAALLFLGVLDRLDLPFAAIAIVGSFTGLFFGVIYVMMQHGEALATVKGGRWDCELRDDAYVIHVAKCQTTLLYWECMEITLEQKGCYVVRCGKTNLTIFRKSLQAAGLDEEFRRRISSKPTHCLEINHEA